MIATIRRKQCQNSPIAALRRIGCAVGFAIVIMLCVLGIKATPAVAAAAQGASVLTVQACQFSDYSGSGSGKAAPWHPLTLPVSLDRKTAARLSFYSDGYRTILGPKGGTCSGEIGGNGTHVLYLYKPGTTPTTSHPSNANPIITVGDNYTGHVPGSAAVAPYFPNSRAARLCAQLSPSMKCASDTSAPGTVTARPTADIVWIRTPQHIPGVIIYPQIDAQSVNTAEATCNLAGKDASLCTPILNDFIARDFPHQ